MRGWWRELPRWRRRLLGVAGAWVLLRAALLVTPHEPLAALRSSSVAVYDAHERLLRLNLAADGQYRLWTPLDEIAELVEATLLYEDRHFYQHFALNPVAMVRAAWWTASGKRRTGASTVTMQLARMRWGIASHSARGKLKQIAGAVWLELRYTKREILEAYLNWAPYGGNIEGAGAASLIYFHQPARKLLLHEALTLAVIPQSPSRRGGRSDEGTAALLAARAGLFERFAARHPERRRDAHLLRLPLEMHPASSLPFLAPHFVDQLQAELPGRGAQRSTLDLRLQRLVERKTQAFVDVRRRLGVRNAAVLLVDTRDMGVRALLGSVDFDDPGIQGQVNGTAAKRSPGSTLKPFVYGLGFQEGVVQPATMLKDVPTSFAGYSPENFDGRYAGPVSVHDALIRSRNIPALSVAARLARPSLYDFLRTAGVSRLRPESHYGLGMVLGAVELSMQELVTLYAALGNHGRLRPLRFTADQPLAAGVPVLDDAAAFLVLDILKDAQRPDRPSLAARDRLPIAWKTGTSYGFRDAWTIGLFGPYALAVWVGNFDGEGNPAFVGAQVAAPLFFELVDAIRAEEPALGNEPERPPPDGVRRVALCALSGALPTEACPHRRPGWFLPGRSPIDTCEVHRRIDLEDATGLRACPGDGDATPSHSEVFEVWPSDLQHQFEVAGLPRRTVPPWSPRCTGAGLATTSGAPPHITSPRRGVTYALRGTPGAGDSRGDRDSEALALEAVTDGDTREVFWFVDQAYVGRSRSGWPLFVRPSPGEHVVRAVDGQSRSDTRALRVELR